MVHTETHLDRTHYSPSLHSQVTQAQSSPEHSRPTPFGLQMACYSTVNAEHSRTSQLMMSASDLATLPGHPPCRVPWNTPTHASLGFSSQTRAPPAMNTLGHLLTPNSASVVPPGHYHCGELQDHPACTQCKFSSPTRAHFVQRAQESQGPMPILALAVLARCLLQRAPRTSRTIPCLSSSHHFRISSVHRVQEHLDLHQLLLQLPCQDACCV